MRAPAICKCSKSLQKESPFILSTPVCCFFFAYLLCCFRSPMEEDPPFFLATETTGTTNPRVVAHFPLVWWVGVGRVTFFFAQNASALPCMHSPRYESLRAGAHPFGGKWVVFHYATLHGLRSVWSPRCGGVRAPCYTSCSSTLGRTRTNKKKRQPTHRRHCKAHKTM